MMKLTARKYVNVRVGKPSVNAPTYQYIAPGSVLDVDDFEYEGDAYDGLTKWYKDAANNYYWKGAFTDPVSFDPNQSNAWFDKLQIKRIWDIEQGARTNVLILDTGINLINGVFDRALKAPVYLTNATFKTESIDPDCHGTHCAALIASRNTAMPVGVAPACGLYVAKVSENGQLNDGATLRSALNEFLKPEYNVDVISISQTIATEDAELQALITQHVQRRRIVVAAIGNDREFKNSLKKRYPGFYNNTISVGACELDGSLSKYTCYPSQASIFCYGSNIKSYKNNTSLIPLTGTSQATAIIAGICALIISYLKKKQIAYDQDFIRTLLRQHATPVTGANYPMIQPLTIFEHLKTLS